MWTTRRQIESSLRRILAGRPFPAPDPGALELQLTARLGGHRTGGMPVTTRTWLRAAAVAAGVVVAAAAASQVPADYAAEIGKRIEFRTAAPLPPAEMRAAVEALRGEAARLRVEVRVRRAESGPVLTRIDVWGNTAGMREVDGILRRAVPALAGADITVSAVEGTVHGNLGGALGQLLGRTDLSPEQLAEAIRRELAAEQSGDVDVQVTREGGKTRVEVKARKVEER